MAKVLAKYETLFILDPTLSEENTAALVEKFKALAEQYSEPDTVVVDDWGKRRLAYEIKKTTEGFYSFIKFTAPTSTPIEIESRIRLRENVLRYLVVKLDEEEE
jgi:small subunit ribosomal protein S6